MPSIKKYNQEKGFLDSSVDKYLGLGGMVKASKGGGLTGGSDDLMGDAEAAMKGQKTITINISRVGVDKLELHTVNLKEGVDQIEQIVKEAFLRVVNSANGISVN